MVLLGSSAENMFYYTEERPPAWRDVESCSLKLPLPTYLYSDNPKKLKKTTPNPIVKNMIGVWQEVKQYMNEPSSLSWFSPIWGNTLFAPGNADGGFRLWKRGWDS